MSDYVWEANEYFYKQLKLIMDGAVVELERLGLI